MVASVLKCGACAHRGTSLPWGARRGGQPCDTDTRRRTARRPARRQNDDDDDDDATEGNTLFRRDPYLAYGSRRKRVLPSVAKQSFQVDSSA